MNISMALGQLNPTTADFIGNFNKAAAAFKSSADILILPEGYVGNYPSDDLYMDMEYNASSKYWIVEYAKLTANTNKAIIVGVVIDNVNYAAFCYDGKVQKYISKTTLPNYDVFDDERWFSTKPTDNIVEWHGIKFGVVICEDAWESDVISNAKNNGAEYIISINSSPYSIAKPEYRMAIFKKRYVETSIPIIFVNQVGGNDELAWDGSSFAFDGTNTFYVPPWNESNTVVIFSDGVIQNPNKEEVWTFENHMYESAVVGLRDYVKKSGFKTIVLGNSGGADSALVAIMAADAVGAENCHHIMMPSKYTDDDSTDFGSELLATHLW